jgi:hypothetical protein
MAVRVKEKIGSSSAVMNVCLRMRKSFFGCVKLAGELSEGCDFGVVICDL